MKSANLAFDLKMAVRTKNYDIVKELVEKNSELHLQMEDGKTLIELMAEVNQWELVDFLAQNRKANELSKIAYGNVLIEAALEGRLETMKYLLKAGASLSCLQEDKTIIELMSETRQWDKVNLITRYRKTDKADTARYASALIDAVREGNMEVVENLLKAGAKLIWIYGSKDYDCLHLAVMNNQPEMIALLLQYGADPEIKNKQGKTACQLADELKLGATWDLGWEIYYKKVFPKDILRPLVQGHRQEDCILSKLPIELVDYTTQFLWKDRKYLNTRTVSDQLKRNSLTCFVNNYSSGFFHYKSEESEKLVNDVKKLLSTRQHDDAQVEIDSFLEKRLRDLPPDKYVKSRAVELLNKFGLTRNKPLKEDPRYPGYFKLAGP